MGDGPIGQGPAEIETGFALDSVAQKLATQGLQVSQSHDAGQYLCNFVYFHALQHFARRAVFVHIPEMVSDRPAKKQQTALTLETGLLAARLILKECSAQIRSAREVMS